MQEDRANYGRPREPGDEPETPLQGYGGGYRSEASPVRGTGSSLSPSDERSWSSLAHLSVLAWPVTGFLPAVPLVLWLVYKDRSPSVGFQAIQSLWYQVAWAVLFAVGGFAGLMLTVLTLGLAAFVLVPLGAVLALVPFAHQLYAAYKVYQGVDYRYPFIANMLDGGRAER